MKTRARTRKRTHMQWQDTVNGTASRDRVTWLTGTPPVYRGCPNNSNLQYKCQDK
jgi:hypothetical protein